MANVKYFDLKGGLWVSEWVIVVQRQLSNFTAISWREQVNFQWDDDEVRFVLDQHTELDGNSASSLKQQYAGRAGLKPMYVLFSVCCNIYICVLYNKYKVFIKKIKKIIIKKKKKKKMYALSTGQPIVSLHLPLA